MRYPMSLGRNLKGILEAYGTDTFEAFSVEVLGFNELTDLSKIQERQTRRVDADLKIKYDANNPSLVKYYAQDLQGLVCSVPASEIARFVNENPDGAVFDLNIRRFLGSRGAVNKDIQGTCTSVESSYEFWFLNNGITIVCDEYDPVTDPDNAHVKLSNLQIVNGCQTATTIALAQKDGKLAQDVRVLRSGRVKLDSLVGDTAPGTMSKEEYPRCREDRGATTRRHSKQRSL